MNYIEFKSGKSWPLFFGRRPHIHTAAPETSVVGQLFPKFDYYFLNSGALKKKKKKESNVFSSKQMIFWESLKVSKSH